MVACKHATNTEDSAPSLDSDEISNPSVSISTTRCQLKCDKSLHFTAKVTCKAFKRRFRAINIVTACLSDRPTEITPWILFLLVHAKHYGPWC